MTDLSELRERLEKAEGPCRELDLAICEALNLVEVEQDDIIGPHPVVKLPGKTYCTAAPLTSSLDAAVALVERQNRLWTMESGGAPSCVYIAQVCSGGDYPGWHEGASTTAALALCTALLRAMEADDDRG